MKKQSREPCSYPFRRFRLRPPSPRRVAKVAGRPLSSFSVLYCYATILWEPHSAGAAWTYLWTVTRKFFLVQYLEKLHVFHIPVKHVDNELDERVPFKPEHVWVYLDFINYWLRPLAMVQHRWGPFHGSKICAEFLRYLKLTYDEAYRMYTTSMTTTWRPRTESRAVRNIHRADPHYLCVPSLHIAIICLCFSFHRMLFEREGFTQEEKARWLPELYRRAVEIAESVLYLKQHSVNCIPAALYMMTRITPGLFTPEDAVAFIGELFKDADDVAAEDKADITGHILFMYERLLLEGAMEDDWLPPVVRWLDGYEPYVPRYAEA